MPVERVHHMHRYHSVVYLINIKLDMTLNDAWYTCGITLWFMSLLDVHFSPSPRESRWPCLYGWPSCCVCITTTASITSLLLLVVAEESNNISHINSAPVLGVAGPRLRTITRIAVVTCEIKLIISSFVDVRLK